MTEIHIINLTKHTQREWQKTEHEFMNIIGIILGWKSTSWPSTMSEIIHRSKSLHDYYQTIARMLTIKFG